MLKKGLLLGASLALAACATPPQPPLETQVSTPRSDDDPLQCAEAAQCTLKVARALLFVFDYAEQGGALVERDGRRLATPAQVKASPWPHLAIELPKAQHSAFSFHSDCGVATCLWTKAQLSRAFARYLDGQRCLLEASRCRD